MSKLQAEPIAEPPGGLAAWLQGPAGRSVAEQESAIAGEILADLFGYHIVQLGNPYPAPLVGASRISHAVVVGDLERPASLAARHDALPLASGSVDVLVLPHQLEFSPQPHEVLREAERVLIAEGHLLLFGFAPASWYGLWRLGLGWRGEVPWAGQFLRRARLADWLKLLGLEVVRAGGCSYRPPLGNPRRFERLAWMERLGRHFWPRLGNCYWLLARKRVLGVRPLPALRARRVRLAATGAVETGMRQAPAEKAE